MQDLQSILSRVLNDNDQNVKDNYADTLECDRSPTESYRVCSTQVVKWICIADTDVFSFDYHENEWEKEFGRHYRLTQHPLPD